MKRLERYDSFARIYESEMFRVTTPQKTAVVHSERLGVDIPGGEAVYSIVDGDWGTKEQMVRVMNASQFFEVDGKRPEHVHAFKDSDKIIFCDFTGHHFLRRKPDGSANVCWSKFLGSWIYTGAARRVWLDREKTKYVVMHSKCGYGESTGKEKSAKTFDNLRKKGVDTKDFEDAFVPMSGDNSKENGDLFAAFLLKKVGGRWAFAEDVVMSEKEEDVDDGVINTTHKTIDGVITQEFGKVKKGGYNPYGDFPSTLIFPVPPTEQNIDYALGTVHARVESMGGNGEYYHEKRHDNSNRFVLVWR